jgi:hypothetical protein
VWPIENLGCRPVTRSAGDVTTQRGVLWTPAGFAQHTSAGDPVSTATVPPADHLLTAITQLPGRGTARSRGQRPTRGQVATGTRSGIDGGEHSARLEGVMAGGSPLASAASA